MGTVHTALAYFLFYKGIHKIGITSLAVLSYLDPIVAILSDIIFFQRQLSWLQTGGILLTFSAAFIIARNR